MQKIILSEKTLGLLIGRLKNFFAGEVIEVEHDNTISPKDILRLPVNFGAPDWWIAMVGSHLMLNDTLRVRDGEPRAMIHVSNTESWATFFKEGDEFYFSGNRDIVVRRVNSSCTWDEKGNNIPTLSRFILKCNRHQISDYSRQIKIQQLENSYHVEREWKEDSLSEMMDEIKKDLDGTPDHGVHDLDDYMYW
jgi:hypothetical protein